MKSNSAALTKWSSVTLTSGVMESLMQALQDDIGSIVCSFESKGENNLLVPRESQLHLSPSTGVVAPTSAASASANTIAGGFLYRLTKMLSDSNREVIE